MGGIVEVEHARHQFGSLVVLDDLSFELSEGEALGVVGPNGAGKTTMLNVVAGDLRPRTRARCDFAGATSPAAGARPLPARHRPHVTRSPSRSSG